MKKISLFTVFIFCYSILQAQIICTIAGNGSCCSSGIGGPATAASINAPNGIVIDPVGTMYFVDYEIVYKVDTLGIISVFAGTGAYGDTGDGGPATAATLNYPEGIAIDKTGNIYISEVYGARIRKVDTAGIIHTIIGNGTSGYSGDGGPALSAELNWPRDVAIDKIGNIYIDDYNNNAIRKVDTSGIITTIAGNGVYGYNGDSIPATTAELDYPNGVAVDSSGNVYIADGDARIRIVNTAGIIYTFAGNGTSGNSGDGGLATAAEIQAPYFITVDKEQNVYMTDFYNNNVRKINAAGIITTIAGDGPVGIGMGGFSGDGGFATLAEIDYPLGIAVDTAENVYIGDFYNLRIRKISTPGISITSPVDTICSGDSIHFQAATTHMCYPNYQWKINGVNAGTDSIIFTTDSLSGMDTITCSLITAPHDTVIVSSNKIIVYVKNCNLGVKTNTPDNALTLYPNPASTELNITASYPINSINISNIFGQQVLYNECNSPQVSISVFTLPPGIYFVKVNGTEVRKFVKK